ncbi:MULTISPECIES: transcriptional regulator TrmB [unclassified Crossiella]|uniref:transcriptional regulator TrmB n=1 Tax=unclassified Crossiella TaxID=2620835 RepID=UPI0020001706|nr:MULTISPECIES: transcriptional regulator TrmB [unclassified Crossiella]MCK2244402.1 transcriptional regulator TrmB [Crossiella sp. S99.2]MCK2257770.1 transcriptional regulator TrmB [Crossiella sp. S99.1]
MDNDGLITKLRRLGLGEAAARLYVLLLNRVPGPLPQLAAGTGLEVASLTLAYGQLVEAGLASAVGAEDALVAPVPPATGLEVLSRRRAAELDDARIAVTNAFECFRRRRLSTYADNLVEVVTGESIGHRIRRAVDSARALVRRFDSPPYFFTAGANATEELAQLARGIQHRSVYSRASLENPGYLTENVEICIGAGEQARVLPSLPVKLTIIDDTCALLSLSIAEADVNNSVLIVRPCGLLSALIAYFELSWQTAIPFYGADPGAERLPLADRRLLVLLAAGLSDERVIREIGVSRRTYFRRLQLLMTRLGATSRFQLALQAQRRGWL